MHVHDLGHQLTPWKSDVVKHTTPQEGVGEFLFGVRGDDDNRTMLRDDALIGLEYVKIHLIEFVKQIVGKLDVGLVNFVDEQHHLFVCSKRLSQTSESDIAFNVRHLAIAKTRIVEALHGIVDIQSVFGLRG